MKQRTWCKKHKRRHTKHALKHCKQHKCGARINLMDGSKHCTLVKVKR